MRVRRTMATVLATTALVVASACAGDDLSDDKKSDQETNTPDKGALTLYGQSFAEAELMANMYELLLEKAGYDVEPKLVTSRDVYMKKRLIKDADVAVEYVGGTIDLLNTTQNGADAKPLSSGDLDETLAAGEKVLDKAGITFLEPAEATDTNAFFVTQDYADENSVSKLSDLKGESVVLAAHADCDDRLDCAKGLEDVYGIDVEKVLPLGFASAQTYKSVIDGESQLGLTSTTDGSLEQQGLVLLDDDQDVQPVQNLVPAVSTSFLEEHPDVADALNPLMAILTTSDLVELNNRVSVERELAADVARDFLEQNDLL